MTQKEIYLNEIKQTKELLKKLLKETTHFRERQRLYDQLAELRMSEVAYSTPATKIPMWNICPMCEVVLSSDQIKSQTCDSCGWSQIKISEDEMPRKETSKNTQGFLFEETK